MSPPPHTHTHTQTKQRKQSTTTTPTHTHTHTPKQQLKQSTATTTITPTHPHTHRNNTNQNNEQLKQQLTRESHAADKTKPLTLQALPALLVVALQALADTRHLVARTVLRALPAVPARLSYGLPGHAATADCVELRLTLARAARVVRALRVFGARVLGRAGHAQRHSGLAQPFRVVEEAQVARAQPSSLRGAFGVLHALAEPSAHISRLLAFLAALGGAVEARSARAHHDVHARHALRVRHTLRRGLALLLGLLVGQALVAGHVVPLQTLADPALRGRALCVGHALTFPAAGATRGAGCIIIIMIITAV